jgi:hypothetical protein
MSNVARKLLPWESNRYRLISLYQMYEFIPERLMSINAQFISIMQHLKTRDQDIRVPKDLQIFIMKNLLELREQCRPLALKSSLAQMGRLKHLDMYTVSEAGKGIEELGNRLRDDLEGMQFLYVSPDLQELYARPEENYGTQVITKFREARRDIAESSKCLAMERPTASVYHSMRIAEHGLRKVAKTFGISFPKSFNSSWGQILQQIDHKIKAEELIPIGKRTAYDRQRIQFYAEAAQHIRHFKEAWRDNVSHARTEYTLEEARKVFDAVRHFMQHLAKGPVRSR